MDNTEQIYKEIDASSILSTIHAYHDEGWRFAQLCGSTIEGGVEVLYTLEKGPVVENVLVNLPNDAEIPSISKIYPASFVFENELQDLFGIKVNGISVDYEGHMYKLSVPSPMNPKSQARVEFAKRAQAADQPEAEAQADTQAEAQAADQPDEAQAVSQPEAEASAVPAGQAGGETDEQ